MKVFVIQPNLAARSEVWLLRMNQILESNIVGIAAFIQEDASGFKYPIFNLNCRRPRFWERQLIRLKLKKYDFSKTMNDELHDAIIDSKADVLLIHFATTAHYLQDLLVNVELPVFIYVHGYDIIWDHKDDKGLPIHTDSYSKDIFKLSKRPNVKFIASSDCSLKCLTKIKISEDKIHRKIFGVNTSLAKRDYKKTSLQVLFLGRFVDYKGPDLVLNAFIKACDLGFQGNLVMAGDGPLRSMCEIIARRSSYSNYIKFTGSVDADQAKILYEESDIYSMHNNKGIITNGFDTFGVTIIEAMATGLPVITAGVGGPSEIIKGGMDGILVQPNNIEQHALAFMQLYINPGLRAELGINAKLKIQENYNAAIEREELLTVLGISSNSI